jgi:hypothetical protein
MGGNLIPWMGKRPGFRAFSIQRLNSVLCPGERKARQGGGWGQPPPVLILQRRK